MSENNRFCTACGARLPEDSNFCPECGASIDGGTNPYASQGPTYGQPVNAKKSNIPTFILLYGIIGTIFGAYMVYYSISFTEAYYNDMVEQMVDIFGQEFADMFPEWTASMQNTMIAGSVCGLASAVCALVSYYFCWKGGPWKNALIFCALSTILSLGIVISDYTGILLFIIGGFVTYKVYTGKGVFLRE